MKSLVVFEIQAFKFRCTAAIQGSVDYPKKYLERFKVKGVASDHYDVTATRVYKVSALLSYFFSRSSSFSLK